MKAGCLGHSAAYSLAGHQEFGSKSPYFSQAPSTCTYILSTFSMPFINIDHNNYDCNYYDHNNYDRSNYDRDITTVIIMTVVTPLVNTIIYHCVDQWGDHGQGRGILKRLLNEI